MVLVSSQVHGVDMRMSEWHFPDVKTVIIQDVTPAHTSTIDNIVSQLPNLQGQVIEWCCWGQFTRELAQALAGAVTRAPARLRHTVRVGDLTDQDLGHMIQAGMAPHILAVSSVQLQSEEHAAAQWLWGELCVSYLDISVVAKLPCQPRAGVQPIIRCKDIVFNHMSEVRICLMHINTCSHKWFLRNRR